MPGAEASLIKAKKAMNNSVRANHGWAANRSIALTTGFRSATAISSSILNCSQGRLETIGTVDNQAKFLGLQCR